TGRADAEPAERMRSELPHAIRERYRPTAATDAVGAAIVGADLVVMRAGGSSIAEVAACGRPMVLIPYPHAGGHQLANAPPPGRGRRRRPHRRRRLHRSRAPPGGGPDGRRQGRAGARMAAASRAFGRPDAAGAVVALLQSLVAG
ncbi:undecaprenyldiphospho-muramoylpentapeptide beta-N- acetylglucosaminyltransferase, partial [mine drainage metagenome]